MRAGAAALLARAGRAGGVRRGGRAVNAGLAQFERVKSYTLLPRELTLDAGELTPTLKVKRASSSELPRRDRAMYSGSA